MDFIPIGEFHPDNFWDLIEKKKRSNRKDATHVLNNKQMFFYLRLKMMK